jgi:hypothetical protein
VCNCGISLELFVELIFQLASLIGYGVGLGGFRVTTGVEPSPFRTEHCIFEIANLRLELAKMLRAYGRLF